MLGRVKLACAGVAVAACALGAGAAAARPHHHSHHHKSPRTRAGAAASTATPVKHLVVIYQENVSFDHYFATYPHATNPSGEPSFHAQRGTPSVNGLLHDGLMNQNPNGVNPQRFDRSQAFTCDQNHDYKPEQQAFDGGLMDRFPDFVGTNTGKDANGNACNKNDVMNYFDGNTVTALWNYAQAFAMSDNSYSTTFGPSTPGALNLVSGQTHGATPATLPDSVANGTVIGDPDPTFDDCSSGTTAGMSGKNIGDLMNTKGVSWGFFQGGFAPTSTTGGKATCGSTHNNAAGVSQKDYSAHHEPFQYYSSTSNPHHVPPASLDEVGNAGQANHQYDLTWFNQAVDAGKLPEVSFVKASRYQDGHAGYSDPLDEQRFLVKTINRLQRSPDWNSTAVVIAYDDSDGWYDHQMGPIVQQSQDPAYDALNGSGLCGTKNAAVYQDRCGYGPRQPLLVVSPFAKQNYVDHSTTDQTSILRFIEDNWSTGRIGDNSFDTKAGTLDGMFDFGGESAKKLFLDPATGARGSGQEAHRH